MASEKQQRSCERPHPHPHPHQQQQQQTHSVMARRPWPTFALAAGLVVFSLWRFALATSAYAPVRKASSGLQLQRGSDYRVPLEAHIMSKCPDALDCLELLLVPTMEQISNKVNLTISYIGEPIASPEEGVSCKHGPSECLGNIIELCSAQLYPDPKQYLGFTLCMTRRYPEIAGADLVRDCALGSGMDFGRLNECVSRDDGAYGMGLLMASVQRSKRAGAPISCTIRLNEQVRCIRDGGEWKECPGGSAVSSLVRDVESLWEKKGGA